MENVSPRKFSGSIVEEEASVTDKVLVAMRGAASPRLREVMAALVRHLHALSVCRPSFACSTMAATERPRLLPRFSARSGG